MVSVYKRLGNIRAFWNHTLNSQKLSNTSLSKNRICLPPCGLYKSFYVGQAYFVKKLKTTHLLFFLQEPTFLCNLMDLIKNIDTQNTLNHALTIPFH